MSGKVTNVVIGIDQSYKNTGISVAVNGKLIKVGSLPLSTSQFNSDKRRRLSHIVDHLILQVLQMGSDSNTVNLKIICERIRTFSGGFLSTEYIKQTGALIACIVDTAYAHGVKVYSVDTRAWKAAVIGTSKGSDGNNKQPAIDYIRKLGWGDQLLIPLKRARKGSFVKDGQHYAWNDDAADSACIALFGFTPGHMSKLKEEK